VQLLLLLVFYVVCVVKAVREGGHGNCARGGSGYSAFRAFQTTYFYFLNPLAAATGSRAASNLPAASAPIAAPSLLRLPSGFSCDTLRRYSLSLCCSRLSTSAFLCTTNTLAGATPYQLTIIRARCCALQIT
jgi:hypothetical protein